MKCNINQLAAALGVSTRTIGRWLRAGKLPQPEVVGVQKLFDLAAVREVLERDAIERFARRSIV
jgi:excisionase family DNA binding protein